VGNTNAADCTTWTRDAESREHRLFEADSLEDGVDAKAVGELAHALDGLLASLAHDVRCAELPRQRDSLGMTSQEDDLLGSETPCGVIAAQVDGAVVIPSR
jgi:hypothetical protein